MKKMMTVIHANDPTTSFLSMLYETREDVMARITETSTNGAIQRAIRENDTIMMLGHGTPYGLLSAPDKTGRYRRLLISDRHVQFLRDKTCIGIWCYADLFAKRYGLHGLFSGMIISEAGEAFEFNINITEDEIDFEMYLFVQRLRYCIEQYGLKDTPAKMKEMDYVKSELNNFNYNNLYYL